MGFPGADYTLATSPPLQYVIAWRKAQEQKNRPWNTFPVLWYCESVVSWLQLSEFSYPCMALISFHPLSNLGQSREAKFLSILIEGRSTFKE